MNVINHLREKKIDKEIILYDGRCYVHEEFTLEQLQIMKKKHPNCKVIAHPECMPEVTENADVVGSTSKMIEFVKEHQNASNPFLLLTECGIASRLKVEHPKLHMIGSCMLCKYMRSNSLENIKRALESPADTQIIEIEPAILKEARRCLDAMFQYG